MKFYKRTLLILAATIVVSMLVTNVTAGGDPYYEDTGRYLRTQEVAEYSKVQVLELDLSISEPEITSTIPEYSEVDETVYTLAETNLLSSTDSDSAINSTIPHSTNLHRIGINADWSMIDCGGEVFLCQEF
ncbi:MAG: hypothetical protein NC548_35420 [Lachnospiraceae bacterium]|nr:hypothetical protein [Lachnospiraceae bacterium]